VEALVPISLFMSVAAVLILRPITRRIGGLIDVMTRERMQGRADDGSDARVVALLDHVSRRLDTMEERIDFTERLVSTSSERRRISRASPTAGQRT
jgi:hypothetical protein